MKSDAKIIELAQERDNLKLKVALLEKERDGLARSSNMHTEFAEDMTTIMVEKSALHNACKAALEYIECCDEPALTKMLQAALGVVKGKNEEKCDLSRGEIAAVLGINLTEEKQGGEKVAG